MLTKMLNEGNVMCDAGLFGNQYRRGKATLAKWILRGILVAGMVLFSGCRTSRPVSASAEAALRVGIFPDYAPIIFEQQGEYVGVDADFARLAAGSLGRPVVFVPMEWNSLIPALLEGDIDVIMSGMSITQGRRARVAFTSPYFEAGQKALLRVTDSALYKTAKDITKSTARIGVIRGSTADMFVTSECPYAKKISYASIHDAVWDLGPHRMRIDLFISDGPAVGWAAARSESILTSLNVPFTKEHMAWAVRRNDEALRDTLNNLLTIWKTDGTWNTVIKRWIP